MSIHSEHSSNREKLLEHLFIGEVLRHLWRQGVTTAESLRTEVDSGGYDLVIECNSIIRHIQLKASYRGAKTAQQKVNLRLAEKPSGCMVWMIFDKTTLALGPFFWFGSLPGERMQDIGNFPRAKHTKGNAQGVKAERPNIRVLKREDFQKVESIPELVKRLFGELPKANQPEDELGEPSKLMDDGYGELSESLLPEAVGIASVETDAEEEIVSDDGLGDPGKFMW